MSSTSLLDCQRDFWYACLHVESVREHLVAGDNVLVDDHGAFCCFGGKVVECRERTKNASKRFAATFLAVLAGALPAYGSSHRAAHSGQNYSAGAIFSAFIPRPEGLASDLPHVFRDIT